MKNSLDTSEGRVIPGWERLALADIPMTGKISKTLVERKSPFLLIPTDEGYEIQIISTRETEGSFASLASYGRTYTNIENLTRVLSEHHAKNSATIFCVASYAGDGTFLLHSLIQGISPVSSLIHASSELAGRVLH